jgi:hypothetical protein
MRIRVLLALSVSILLPVVPCLRASAQAVANAQIHGTVRDGSGAVVPNAQIKATQIETGRVQTTVSGSDGTYSLPNLPVGSYSLAVTAPSFSSYTQSGIELQVGNNVQVNVSLQLGSVSQEVHVSANAQMVQTQDTSISQVIDQRRIVDLPLNGRQATDLITLSGGAAIPPNSTRVITTHDYPNAVGVSVSGGQINGNNYLLDGADHNDSHSNVNLPFPFPDALQEFNVQTSGISSRYGLHPGAVVNVVTKSGTNQIHGDLFEFLRNGDFNARNYFATAQDSLHRNQFGGTVGLPIVRNRVFLFSGFQATRERTAPPEKIAFVPTAAVLAGDFSAVDGPGCQSNGVGKQLVNPSTGQPYPNDHIDPATFNQPALNLLKLIPVSSDPCGRITFAIPNPNDENQYIGRADWVQSAKNTIFGRYFISDYANPPYYTNNLLTTTRSGLNMRAQSVAVADETSFSTTFLNAVHLDYSRLTTHRAQPPNMPSPSTLGVNMYNPIKNFVDLAVTNYFSVGGGSNAPAAFLRNQYQGADDIDLIRGKHHFSMGAEVISGDMIESNLQYANGEFSFNGSRSGDALADLMLGALNTVIDSNYARVDLVQKYLGAYFEDSIQFTPRLNVHAGVRWEPFLPEHDKLARGNHFDPAAFVAGTKTQVYTNAPPGLFFYGDRGIPKSYAHGNWHDFAPRLGFAYDLTGTGNDSLRGSYGIFFDQPESFTIRDFGISAPWGNAITLTAPAGGFSDPVAGYTFPTPVPPTKDAVFPLQGSYINMPLDLHHPYMQQYDLSFEHQQGKNWLFSVNYVGNRATHLRSGREQNPAVYIPGASTVKNTAARRTLTLINPATGQYYSSISYMDDGINTFYNAFRATAEHRFANHYTLLSVYTWSRCMQDAETLGNRLSGSNESDPYDKLHDFGPCDFDIRHNWINSVVLDGPHFQRRLMNEAAGGWQLAFLLNLHSGFPFNPTTGTDRSLSGVGLDRPDVVQGAQRYIRDKHTLQWVNPAAYVPNALGTFGTAGANSLYAPGYFDTDASLTKGFQITERQQFRLRFEFFNVFNHTNFLAPVSTRSSSQFGVIQSSNPARIIQLAGKYVF